MTEFCKRCKQPQAHPFHAPRGIFGREMKTHEYEPWDSRLVRLHDPSTWEPLTPTPKPEEAMATRVTWEDVQKQAMHCPLLSAMLVMRRQGTWNSPEEALLWVVMELSKARIRALEEHAQTLMQMKP